MTAKKTTDPTPPPPLLTLAGPWVTDATKVYGEIDVRPSDEDQRFYSVTTVIGCLDKPALMYWAAEEAAKCAVANRSTLGGRVKSEGEGALVKWLRDARFRTVKGVRSATQLGTDVHAACEEYGLTGVRPEVDDEVAPFLDQFDAWCQIWQPEYIAVEAAVFNRTYGYAGTLDAICKVGDQTVLLDYKTSRKSIGSDDKPTSPYPEVALQLAAYRHAELMAVWRARRFEKYRRRYYLLNDTEVAIAPPMPTVDGCVVLHLTPEHADLYPIRTDDAVFEAFLYVQEAFRWTNETSKSVIGDRLVK